MCGIAGIYRRTDKPVAQAGRLVDALFHEIENRGTHSTGWLAMLDNGRVQMEKSMKRASLYVPGRGRFNDDFRSILLHTRFATRGKHTLRNAHPQISATCAAVHNGTIFNADAVFAQTGIKRYAEVDSEVIPAIVSWGEWKNAAEALSLLSGGMATAIVSNQHPDELILATLVGYPLHYLVNDDLLIFASTKWAITQAWWRVYGGVPEGRLVEMPAFRMHRIGPAGIERVDIEDRYKKITWSDDPAKRPTSRSAYGYAPSRANKWPPASKPTGGKPKAAKSVREAIDEARSKQPTSKRPVSGTTAKKRRKRSKKGQLQLPQTASNASGGATTTQGTPLSYERPESSTTTETPPYDWFATQAVDDLVRYTGMSRQDAEEEVYGFAVEREDWVARELEDTAHWLAP